MKKKWRILPGMMLGALLLSNTNQVYSGNIDSPEYYVHKETENGIMYYLNEDNTISINGVSSDNEDTILVIPETIEGFPVVKIAPYAFYRDLYHTQVQLPETIKKIEHKAFAHSGLETINFPESLEEIEESAFYYMNSYNGEVVLPESIKIIGQKAFGNCCGIDTLYIPASVEELGGSITGNANAKVILDPENDHYLQIDNAIFDKEMKRLVYFPNDETITHYTIPEGVEEIAAGVFLSRFWLTQVDIPQTVKIIEDEAFAGCQAYIELPDSLEIIGSGAFSSSNLFSVYIPKTVKQIGTNPFENCRISEISVDQENEVYGSIDGVLFEKDTRTLIAYPMNKPGSYYSIPEGIECIGNNAFINNSVLTEVYFPETLTDIDEGAFDSCNNLRKADIPLSVTYIGSRAFMGCALEGTLVPKSVIYIGDNAFSTYVGWDEQSIMVYRDSYAHQWAQNMEVCDFSYTVMDEIDWLTE